MDDQVANYKRVAKAWPKNAPRGAFSIARAREVAAPARSFPSIRKARRNRAGGRVERLSCLRAIIPPAEPNSPVLTQYRITAIGPSASMASARIGGLPGALRWEGRTGSRSALRRVTAQRGSGRRGEAATASDSRAGRARRDRGHSPTRSYLTPQLSGRARL